MKKLNSLLVASVTLGLSIFAMSANANVYNKITKQTTTTETTITTKPDLDTPTVSTPTVSTPTVSTPTVSTPTTESVPTTATVSNLKKEHHFLFQLSGEVGLSSTPDPVTLYTDSAATSQVGGNLRFGFKVYSKLNYDFNPFLYSTDYITAGVHTESIAVEYTPKVSIKNWSGTGVSLGYQIEYSRSDMSYWHGLFMPAELVVTRESFDVSSPYSRYLHTNNLGDAHVTDYNEARSTISYFAGFGGTVGPLLVLSKFGYNFTQSAFKFEAELGLGF